LPRPERPYAPWDGRQFLQADIVSDMRGQVAQDAVSTMPRVYLAQSIHEMTKGGDGEHCDAPFLSLPDDVSWLMT
jgi:hypothetical protein